jgi:hypothetical protein
MRHGNGYHNRGQVTKISEGKHPNWHEIIFTLSLLHASPISLVLTLSCLAILNALAQDSLPFIKEAFIISSNSFVITILPLANGENQFCDEYSRPTSCASCWPKIHCIGFDGLGYNIILWFVLLANAADTTGWQTTRNPSGRRNENGVISDLGVCYCRFVSGRENRSRRYLLSRNKNRRNFRLLKSGGGIRSKSQLALFS